MLHLMQDLLHWAHKLARSGLVELGCVSRGPENDCKGNWDKKYRRNAWVIQAYVLPLHPVRSAGKDFSRFASTIKSDNGAVHFVGTVPLFLYILYIHHLIFGLLNTTLLMISCFSSFCGVEV